MCKCVTDVLQSAYLHAHADESDTDATGLLAREAVEQVADYYRFRLTTPEYVGAKGETVIEQFVTALGYDAKRVANDCRIQFLKLSKGVKQ